MAQDPEDEDEAGSILRTNPAIDYEGNSSRDYLTDGHKRCAKLHAIRRVYVTATRAAAVKLSSLHACPIAHTCFATLCLNLMIVC